jgi:hypothetical protein
MAEPLWTLEDDGKSLAISFPVVPPVTLHLSTEEVESFVNNLSLCRSVMQPPHPADWAPGQQVAAIPDPRWYVEAEALHGNSLLHIRDPRYGWLHYVLPREEARALGTYLVTQANAPPPSPPPEKLM